ncbi:MAG: efflux transporter outer membrane subunit [Syntrophales bacterium]|jgi:NodT family efflux transporter outer membrane factor (OMF) lipoprotein|nr:efflux transporter outer membrane subunit [Syntrophales bacterium]
MNRLPLKLLSSKEIFRLKLDKLSFLRKHESRPCKILSIPAFAGMTKREDFQSSRVILPWAISLIVSALALLFLAGCATVGPNYVSPRTTLPTAWNTPLQGGITVSADPKELAAWWTTLNDPELSRLIDRAAAGNLDLKKAVARVREARARRGLSKTGLYPALDASGSASRSRGSGDIGPTATTDLFSAGLDVSWEIDLFGGVRRSVEAADADVQAAGEDLHDTLVSLLAEVGINYVDLRTAQARLAVTETSLKSLEETHSLAQWRAQAGLGDELAVQQARYNLESARSQIPTLLTAIAEAQNRLAVLLGEAPGAVHAELSKPEPVPILPPEVAIGVPADLLRQRPDVRKTERQLAAQTARIGVATADLYPKLKLSGAIGLQALAFGGLFNAANATSSGSSGLTWRVFDAGAIRKNIEIQSALQEQSLIAYESAVLGAQEEAENAIMAYAQEQRRRQSLAWATRSAQAAAELAGIKYRAGLIDFTAVLEAERSLLGFRDQLAQSDGAIVTNMVRLYKALGGGWTVLTPAERETSTNGAKS